MDNSSNDKVKPTNTRVQRKKVTHVNISWLQLTYVDMIHGSLSPSSNALIR